MSVPSRSGLRRFSISGKRFAAIVLLGPLVGAIFYAITALILEPMLRGDEEVGSLIALMVFMGWFIGLVPAIVGAIAWALVPHPRGRWQRAGLALGIGAIATCIGFAALAVPFGFQLDDPRVFVLGAMSGAVALCVTGTWGAGEKS